MKTLKITKTPKGKIKITDANNFSVCLMSSNVQKENEDMAKLFAASPELLEACNKAFTLCDKLQMPTESELNELKSILNNAIKKASE